LSDSLSPLFRELLKIEFVEWHSSYSLSPKRVAILLVNPVATNLSDLGPITKWKPVWTLGAKVYKVKLLFQEIRRNPLLWLLVFVPVVLAAEKLKPESHTLLFVLSVLAILPLATLLSHATESVAAKTGDSIGGLLNSTLGNMTELVIAITALQAGQYTLVKASIAGAIVTNSLFMLGMSFLLGGLRYHVQEFNRIGARMQAGLLFLATVALSFLPLSDRVCLLRAQSSIAS
jgi:Ca2+/H+ antiporter